MEEGKLAKWLVKEGDQVKSGDVIAEIETDKATMEVEAVDEGKVSKILVPEGTEGVKVNTPIAVLARRGRGSRRARLPRQRGSRPGRRPDEAPPPTAMPAQPPASPRKPQPAAEPGSARGHRDGAP